jgi:hypothetical protein
MRTIFDAGPQRWKVWFVLFVCLLTGGGMMWAGGYMLGHYGLMPGDGGVLKPLSTRLLVGGVMAVPGAALIAAIVVYLRCYVTRIEVDDAGSGFRVTVAGRPGPRTLMIGAGDVVRARYNDGIAHAGGVRVNAPWYSLRLPGRRLPLIIDMQGDFLDDGAVDRLIKGEPPLLAPRRERKLPGREHRR